MSASLNAQGTAGNGQDPTAHPAGIDEGSNPAVVIKAPGVSYEVPQPKKEEPKKETPAPEIKKEEPAAPQPTDKDYRHAQQKITKEIELKLALARKMVEKDADAIYDIAETDRSLAEKLLEEYDYGTKSLEEFLEKKESESVEDSEMKVRVLKVDKRLASMEKKLTDERIQRMREKHPDLSDELEREIRTLYSDPRFAEATPEKVLAVARAMSGETDPIASANDVALSLLKANEGASTSLKGDAGAGKRKDLTPQQAAIQQQFGHTDADREKYLPPNLDEILGLG